MIVNILKIKVMIFESKKASHQQHIFYFNHQVIEITKQYKYLGAIFSSEYCLFNKHFDGSLSSASFFQSTKILQMFESSTTHSSNEIVYLSSITNYFIWM